MQQFPNVQEQDKMTSTTATILIVLLIGIISVCFCKNREGCGDDSNETIDNEKP